MKNDILRGRLLKCKSLLYDMYSVDMKEAKNILDKAPPYTINTILHYIHKLCNGHVRLRNGDFQEIKRKKKLKILRKGIELKSSLRQAIKQKDTGLNFLKNLACVLPIIFRPMFEK